MTDGPHKSLPMKPGWRRVARLAWNPAFSPDQVAEVIPRALLGECSSDFVRQVVRVLNPTDQKKLFEESPHEVAAMIHKLRTAAPGSQFAENLIEAAIYELYNPSGNGSIIDAALRAALHATTESALRGIEEHGLRQQGDKTAADLRDRLCAAGDLLDYKAVADQLIVGSDTRRTVTPPKRTGLDDGAPL